MVETSSACFLSYADALRPRIEQSLAAYCRPVVGCPATLGEAIRYSLLAPAKRLRPMLVLLAAEACGGDSSRNGDEAMPAAVAVEMIHTYSLIHDDLPAMDDDDLRRGRPTCHKVYGEALAILAGDALLAQAFEVLAEDVRPAALAARCCASLARAAGRAALVGGQADDLTGVESNLAALEAIHARKTGAMFLVSLELGGLAAGATAEQLAALDAYGQSMGLAFQITDDLLDVSGSEAAAGKRLGKDADRGKLTFPGLIGIEESRARAAALVAEACKALAPLGSAAEGLEALARYVLERDR
ncbi:MAG TPA: farnesyl diphosphate synthase [Pirellulales bacterium]|jgi:geranylgeranyl diphosphate synthase type II|nr:farnesyl diphosphate synthase [Pirellulales bacterium]